MLVYTYEYSYNRHIASNQAKLLKGYKAMTNLFKQAHALTRATIQTGDSYAATFTLCLRAIIADNKARLVEHSANTVFDAIGYKAPVVASDTIDTAIKTTIVMMFIVSIMALFIALFIGGTQ